MSMAKDEGASVLVNIKAVPGAKRDEVVGRLGERLKVRVSAPPEGGRANDAICELLAKELGVGIRMVTIVRGRSNPEKTVRVEGKRAAEIEKLWPS